MDKEVLRNNFNIEALRHWVAQELEVYMHNKIEHFIDLVLREHQKFLIEPVVRAGFLACPLANVSQKPMFNQYCHSQLGCLLNILEHKNGSLLKIYVPVPACLW